MVYHTSRCRSKPLASALLSLDLSSTLSSEHSSERQEVGEGLWSDKKTRGSRGGGGGECRGGREERKRPKMIGLLPLRAIITISEFSMKRQQVEPNGKYADVCKCALDGSPRGPVGD